MQELLEIVNKLKESVVMPNKLSKYRKKELLGEIDDRKLLQKMAIFYAQGPEDGIPSRIAQQPDDDRIVPSKEDLGKMKVGQIRKLVRSFYRDSGLLRGKLESIGHKKLSVFARKHNFRDMAGLPMEQKDEKIKSIGPPEKPTKAPTKQQMPLPSDGPPTTDTAGLLQHLNDFSKQFVKVGDDRDNLLGDEQDNIESDPLMNKKPVSTQQQLFDPYNDQITSLAPHLFQRLCERALILDMTVLDCKIKKLKEFCAAIEGDAREVKDTSAYLPGSFGALGGPVRRIPDEPYYSALVANPVK